MNKLTDEQIDYVVLQVNKSHIDSRELKEDLIDHFCCFIEDYMAQGKNFDESYIKAYEIICPNGFDEIHEETIMLLTSKNIILMKKALYITGFIASLFITTSFLFKALHWPGAGVSLLVSAVVLIFILLPLVLLYFYRKEFSNYISYKLKYVFGYLGVALLLSAVVIKLLHWPGSGIVFLFSVAIINFGFLPFLFYRIYKKSAAEDRPENVSSGLNYIFGYLGAALFITASVLKILHWPGSGVILVVSIVIVNFGFLPLLFYRMYKKSIA